MKKLILTIICALTLFTAQAQNAKVVINGAINDTLYITTYQKSKDQNKNYNKFIFGTKTPGTQTFEIPAEACTNNRFYLSANHNYTFLELKPGQTLHIDLKDSEMKLSGDNLKVNQYLYDWLHENIMSFENGLKFRWHMLNKFNNYKNFLPKDVSLYQNQTKYKTFTEDCLAQLKKSGINDSEFLIRQKNWIKYTPYLMHYENYNLLQGMKVTISDSYKEYFKDWKFNDSDLLQFPDAAKIIENNFVIEENLFAKKSSLVNQVADFAKRITNQEVREFYILNQLDYLLRADMAFELDKITQSVAPFLVSDAAKKALKEKMPEIDELAAKNMVGKPAYNFAYENRKGEIVKLSDFKGKYVFIDIWATWCGPCVMNIPYVNSLEEELKGSNIAFISISFDIPKNKNKWLDFLATNKTGEIQLLSNDGFKGEMGNYYGVNSIPRFLLIDPNGNIISAKCRQPMNKAFREHLIDLVRSNKNNS